MTRYSVTLSLDRDLWRQYQTACRECGMVPSRRIDVLLRNEIERWQRENRPEPAAGVNPTQQKSCKRNETSEPEAPA